MSLKYNSWAGARSRNNLAILLQVLFNCLNQQRALIKVLSSKETTWHDNCIKILFNQFDIKEFICFNFHILGANIHLTFRDWVPISFSYCYCSISSSQDVNHTGHINFITSFSYNYQNMLCWLTFCSLLVYRSIIRAAISRIAQRKRDGTCFG